MDTELESLLNRADELLKDLEEEYEHCLFEKQVTNKAKNLTHEIIEKLRNSLDQTMYKAWEKHTSPYLPNGDKNRARIYFPIANDLDSFKSVLRRGLMQDLDQHNKDLYDFLVNRQPFKSEENKWLKMLRDIANKKHVGLIPQKRTETQRQKVSREGVASVSWDPSCVKYSSGISILEAPIDEKTQRILPTPGITEKIEIWVSFTLEEYGISALGFCEEACQKTRNLIADMTRLI